MWILPTRSRPGNLQRAVENFPEAPITVVRTEGDPYDSEYQQIKLPETWKEFWVPSNSTVPELLNRVYEAYPCEAFYGFIGDDVIPEGDKWWEVLGKKAGRWHVAFPKDSIHEDRLCPHFILGGDLVRSVRHLAEPRFHHSFIDTVWYALGKNLDLLAYEPSIIFHHQHPLDPKTETEMDSIYILGQSHYTEDQRKFREWINSQETANLVAKLRSILRVVQGHSTQPIL